MRTWRRLTCFFFGHDVYLIRAVSRQAALARCRCCRRLFVAKMEGEHKGHLIPWELAEAFYTKFSARLLRQVPYAYCCNGVAATCDCVYPDHSTALEEKSPHN